jgi:hypothetical protein
VPGKFLKESAVRRFIQCVSAAALLVSAASGFATGFDYSKEDLADYSPHNDARASDNENAYARDGKAVYLFGGYMFVHSLWSNSTKTVVTGSGTFTYQPNDVFSSNFNTFQIGVGKELSAYFDFQFSYLQYLEKTKSTTVGSNTFSTKVQTNGVLSDVAVIFNPDSQFQVSAKLGAMIAQYAISIAQNSGSYFAVDDNTRIEPAIGMDFLFNITPSTGIRTGILYVMEVQNKSANGSLAGTIGLNYTF